MTKLFRHIFISVSSNALTILQSIPVFILSIVQVWHSDHSVCGQVDLTSWSSSVTATACTNFRMCSEDNNILRKTNLNFLTMHL